MKSFKSYLIPAVGAAVISLSSFSAVATEINPYDNVKTVDLTGQAKVDYIHDKTAKLFSGAPVPGFSATTTANLAPQNYVVPKGWTQELLTMNGVSVEKYAPAKKKTDRIVLFFHGGGYVGGLHDRYRDWGIHLGELAGDATVLMLDYRIAPANVYPAALEDAVNAYTGLLKAGYDPNKIVLVGDSAGGNLASALAVYSRDHNIALPKSMVLISPWTHLEMGALPSHTNNYKKDRILGEVNQRLSKEVLEGPSYAKGAPERDPYISTSEADLTGLPQMLITAGGDEVLLDDAALFAAHAQAAGVPTKFTVYPGMSHDWTIILPELQESKAMNNEISKFMKETVK